MSEKEYIEKKEALDNICYDCMERSFCSDLCMDYKRISELPPASVAPVVRGEWITVSESEWDGNEYKCSACGWKCCDDEYGDNPTEDYRFCPNCGAAMTGEAVRILAERSEDDGVH